MIHAYVHLNIGYENVKTFPTWFDEGTAIFFSGSGAKHVVEDFNGSYSTAPSQDYQQYDLNFEYLEANLGRPRMLELIKQSIDQRDYTVALRALHIADYSTLVSEARDWQQKETIKWIVFWILGILDVVWIIRLTLPKAPRPYVTCKHCGYEVDNRTFQHQFCTQCLKKL